MKTDLVVSGYLIENDKILLIDHKKLNLWLPPGGHIDPNETPDQALIREFKEETNLDIEILNQDKVVFPKEGKIKKVLALPIHVNVHLAGDHDHCCFYYLCKSNNLEDLKIRESEINDARWFSKDELDNERLPKNVKIIILRCFEMMKKIKSDPCE